MCTGQGIPSSEPRTPNPRRFTTWQGPQGRRRIRSLFVNGLALLLLELVLVISLVSCIVYTTECWTVHGTSWSRVNGLTGAARACFLTCSEPSITADPPVPPPSIAASRKRSGISGDGGTVIATRLSWPRESARLGCLHSFGRFAMPKGHTWAQLRYCPAEKPSHWTPWVTPSNLLGGHRKVAG